MAYLLKSNEITYCFPVKKASLGLKQASHRNTLSFLIIRSSKLKAVHEESSMGKMIFVSVENDSDFE